MKNYKSIMKNYNKYINEFNLKYSGKYILSSFLNLSDDKQGFYLYLHSLKDNLCFPMQINLEDLDKFEPKYVIFRLIENGIVKGSD